MSTGRVFQHSHHTLISQKQYLYWVVTCSKETCAVPLMVSGGDQCVCVCVCVMSVIHSNADCCTLADCTIPSSDQSLEAPLTWVLISRDILLHFTEECRDFLPPCLYFSFTEFKCGGVWAIHKPGYGVESAGGMPAYSTVKSHVEGCMEGGVVTQTKMHKKECQSVRSHSTVDCGGGGGGFYLGGYL